MTCHPWRRYGTLVAALLGLLSPACGSIGPRLEPAQVARVRRTMLRSHIPERQVRIMWVASHMGGGLGLMGAVIDGSVNRGRKNAAEEMVRPLHAQTMDVNYQWMFWSSLEAALRDVMWLKPIGFDRKPAPFEDLSDQELAQHAVLRMGTGFEISVDSSTLLVETGLGFFEQGGSGSLAAATSVCYRSAQVGPVENEKAISLWAANGGARYRMAVAEGIAENVKLIRLATLCMGGMNCPFESKHHLRFRLGEGRGDFGVRVGVVDADGTIIEEGPYRVVFRDSSGSFYSIPRSSIESQSGHGPPPAPPPVLAPPPVAPAPPPVAPAPSPALPSVAGK
jgi:hypothetical protein